MLKLLNAHFWTVIKSNRSNSIATAECPSNTTLTGCTCHSSLSCEGATFEKNKCLAYNFARGTGVWAYARCGHIPQSSNWTVVRSIQSDTSANANITAKCPIGMSLTGCTCHSTMRSCNGALMIGNICVAFNRRLGNGVRAIARCVKVPTTSEWMVVKSKKSQNGNSFIVADCPSDWLLTDCTCYTQSKTLSCDGVIIEGNKCIAQNNGIGNGVWAYARCYAPDKWQGCSWETVNHKILNLMSVGNATSPTQCLTKVKHQCSISKVATIVSSGNGECFCGDGLDSHSSHSTNQKSCFIDTKCPSDWIHYEKSCYKLVKSKLNWWDAMKFCESKGGHLVSFSNAEEENFAKTLWTTSGSFFIWFGLNDLQTPGVFAWHEPIYSNVIYTNWKNNITLRDQGDQCVGTTTTGPKKWAKWSAMHCATLGYFICEKASSKIPPKK